MSGAPFRSPEHCLTVAFAFAEYRIEPRNATAAVIHTMREKAGDLAARDTRPPTGMSQHDWHAQAAMAVSFTQRQLGGSPQLWDAVLAEYSHGVEGALAIQRIADAIAGELEGQPRLLADMLIMRAFRGRPRLRDVADRCASSVPTASRMARQWHGAVASLRGRAISSLLGPMEEAGLVDAAPLTA